MIALWLAQQKNRSLMENNATHVICRNFSIFKEWFVKHALQGTVFKPQVIVVRALHQLYLSSIATSSAIVTSMARSLYLTTSLETVEKTRLSSTENSVLAVHFLLTLISISRHAHHANLDFPSIHWFKLVSTLSKIFRQTFKLTTFTTMEISKKWSSRPSKDALVT